ncbi:hypothetical protein [Brevundimonas phoenicis]|uniref:hypothetical protein n=1 Tax=unclassified Brevundimonas TaxID=2622653 RepID=UPI00399F3A53
MTKIVALGHSHLNRVRSALDHRQLPLAGTGPSDLAAVWLHDVWVHNTDYAAIGDHGEIEFNSYVIAQAESQIVDMSDAIYCVQFGGSGHVILGLQRLSPAFDFVYAGAPNLPIEPNAMILPMDLVSAALDAHMAPYMLQLKALRRMIKQPIICLETPPPYEDDAYVASHLGSYIASPENVVGAPLRRKLFLLHSQKVRNFCEENEIEYMSCPPQTLTDDGYLVREGYGEDATHANLWYGEQVLRQIEERILQKIGAFTAFA